jgi:hypothetical protein
VVIVRMTTLVLIVSTNYIFFSFSFLQSFLLYCWMSHPVLMYNISYHHNHICLRRDVRLTGKKLLLNPLFIITLRAGAVPPGDSLEFLARRHGAGSRCQLRKTEEEREEVV